MFPMPHMCLWPSRGSFPWAMSLIPLDTIGYKPVCCKNEHTNKKNKQADRKEPDHYIPSALPASANQPCHVNTRNKHSLRCKRNFSPELQRIKNTTICRRSIVLFLCLLFWFITNSFASQSEAKEEEKTPPLAYNDWLEHCDLLNLSWRFCLPLVCPCVSNCSDKLTVASHQNSATSPILMDVSRVSHTSILNIFPTKISAGRPACRLSSTTVRSKLSSSVWKWKTSWETESRESFFKGLQFSL